VFDLSPEKILFLGVIAIMVLGPDRLPQAARTLAKVLHQFRTASGSLQSEMRDVLAEPRRAVNDAISDLGLPTDFSVPRVPTARNLLTHVLDPPPERSEALTNGVSHLEASTLDGAAVEASYPGATPDDPSLN
jgi:Sec-independent protein translocase protein TatA